MKLDELKTQLALGTIKWRTDTQRYWVRTGYIEDDIKDDIENYVDDLKFDGIFWLLSCPLLIKASQRKLYERFITSNLNIEVKHIIHILNNGKLYNALSSISKIKVADVLRRASVERRISIVETGVKRRKKVVKND